MTIQKQLRLLTAATIVSLAAVVGLTVASLTHLRQQFAAFEAEQTIAQSMLEIQATALGMARADPILPDTPSRLDSANSRIHRLVEQIAAQNPEPATRKAMDMIVSNWSDYHKGFAGAIKIASESPADALQIPDALYKSNMEPMVNTLDNLVTRSKTAEAVSSARIRDLVQRILVVVLAPLVAAGLVVTVFQLWFGRRLNRQVEGIRQAVEELRRGNLNRRLPAEGKDEISFIAQTINGFIAHFEALLREAGQTADRTRRAVDHVMSISDQVSAKAKYQADSIGQVSQAVEEMEASGTEMARNAGVTAEAAESMQRMVGQGNETGRLAIAALRRIDETVGASAETIGHLDAATARIGTVSNMIKEIADQTNLLSLNAAIEAARAGEQGRGFAVVADEVRKLSERTAASTNDIAEMLRTVQGAAALAMEGMMQAKQEVAQGVAQGQRMGELLSAMEQSVETVNAMVRQTAAATEAQTETGAHIAANMEEVTRTIASTMEDIRATRTAMEGLVSSAATLQQSLAQFQVSVQTGGGNRPAS